MSAYPQKFDAIRCFSDEEVNPALQQILSQKEMINKILCTILGHDIAEYFLKNLAPIHSLEDFQREVIAVLLSALEFRTCKEVRLFNTDRIHPAVGHLFLTNHRDIVLDSAFLNEHLFYKGFGTTQIAIGDNLLIQPWIELAVRLNKSFIVRRNGSIKEQLMISKNLSEYIRYVLTERKESVWMAQREGRAKDSNDRTASAIIKMLNMSGEGTFVEKMKALHINPIAINYEFDPCDYLKAREFQLKRDDAHYKKQPADDLLSMKTGLMAYKGNVSYVVTGELDIPQEWNEIPRNQQADALAAKIDHAIHTHYLLYPNNYIAADLLRDTQEFVDKYTPSDLAKFVRYIEAQLQKIDIENKDVDFLRHKMYEMYANPALNQQVALAQ